MPMIFTWLISRKEGKKATIVSLVGYSSCKHKSLGASILNCTMHGTQCVTPSRTSTAGAEACT